MVYKNNTFGNCSPKSEIIELGSSTAFLTTPQNVFYIYICFN